MQSLNLLNKTKTGRENLVSMKCGSKHLVRVFEALIIIHCDFILQPVVLNRKSSCVTGIKILYDFVKFNVSLALIDSCDLSEQMIESPKNLLNIFNH